MALKARKNQLFLLALLALTPGCGKLRQAIEDLDLAKRFAQAGKKAGANKAMAANQAAVADACEKKPRAPSVTVAGLRALKDEITRECPVFSAHALPDAHSSAFVLGFRDFRRFLSGAGTMLDPRAYRELGKLPEDQALTQAFTQFGIPETSNCAHAYLSLYAYRYAKELDLRSTVDFGQVSPMQSMLSSEPVPSAAALITGLGDSKKVALLALTRWDDSSAEAVREQVAKFNALAGESAPGALVLDLRGATGSGEKTIRLVRDMVAALQEPGRRPNDLRLIAWVDGRTEGDAENLLLELAPYPRFRSFGMAARTAGYARKSRSFTHSLAEGGAPVTVTLGCEKLLTPDGQSTDGVGVAANEVLPSDADAERLAREAER